MPTDRSAWPKPARDLADGVQAATAACAAGDRAQLEDAVGDLARGDREQLAVLLGTATRDLLERALPDGLDAEGAEIVLDAAVRSARSWFPEVDDDLLLRALTGALGVGDLPEAPPADPTALLTHGLVLVAALLHRARMPAAAAVDAAMAELIRAQTIELP